MGQLYIIIIVINFLKGFTSLAQRLLFIIGYKSGKGGDAQKLAVDKRHIKRSI
jgi:hypothetical protein